MRVVDGDSWMRAIAEAMVRVANTTPTQLDGTRQFLANVKAVRMVPSRSMLAVLQTRSASTPRSVLWMSRIMYCRR